MERGVIISKVFYQLKIDDVKKKIHCAFLIKTVGSDNIYQLWSFTSNYKDAHIRLKITTF